MMMSQLRLLAGVVFGACVLTLLLSLGVMQRLEAKEGGHALTAAAGRLQHAQGLARPPAPVHTSAAKSVHRERNKQQHRSCCLPRPDTPLTGEWDQGKWSPDSCSLPYSSWTCVARCIMNTPSRWVVLAGDSNIRNTYLYLIQQLRNEASQLGYTVLDEVTGRHLIREPIPHNDVNWWDRDTLFLAPTNASAAADLVDFRVSLRFIPNKHTSAHVFRQPSAIRQGFGPDDVMRCHGQPDSPNGFCGHKQQWDELHPSALLYTTGLWNAVRGECDFLERDAFGWMNSTMARKIPVRVWATNPWIGGHPNPELTNVHIKRQIDCGASLFLRTWRRQHPTYSCTPGAYQEHELSQRGAGAYLDLFTLTQAAPQELSGSYHYTNVVAQALLQLFFSEFCPACRQQHTTSHQ